MLICNRTILILAFVIVLDMGATPSRADSIQDYCKGVVGESYTLMEACLRGEEEARARLQTQPIDPQIKSYCKKIVGKSYTLMESCVRQEEAARANVQSRQADPQEDANESKGGEKGRLASLLVDYANFRQQVLEVREARKSGYSSDGNSLVALAKGMMESMAAARKFRSSVHVVGVTDTKAEITASNLVYAYGAMSQIVYAEMDRNLYLQKSDIPLRLAEKYEEIWKMIDASIPVVSIP